MSLKKKDTSWDAVADWYDEYLGKEDTYQSKVILPNLLRLLSVEKGERILDLACGQGFFTREIVACGAKVAGIDIAPQLVAVAREHSREADFRVASASNLSFADDDTFDAVVCVLALQNMEDLASVFREVSRVLKRGGRFVFVLNHPAFRVPQRSSWGWDQEQKVQYRRVDGYLSAGKVSIDMHPGSSKSEQTVSHHRSLQDFFKALSKAGFAVSRLEEWISHKTSGSGPRKRAEDRARGEIPLFMAIEARHLPRSLRE